MKINEIIQNINEKSYGASKTNIKTLTSDQLQVQALEKKLRGEVASGDVCGSARVKAEVAHKKAQIKRNKAQQDLNTKAHNLTMARGS
jgi:hypothetical protein